MPVTGPIRTVYKYDVDDDHLYVYDTKANRLMYYKVRQLASSLVIPPRAAQRYYLIFRRHFNHTHDSPFPLSASTANGRFN